MIRATDNVAPNGHSLNAETLHRLRPVAFVDDYLPYLVRIDSSIHPALIMRAATGLPQCW